MESGGGYAVGIDLGTSNTVAILRWPDGRTRPILFDGQPVLPSAVFLDPGGALHVGRDAQRMAQLDPARYEPNPKRRIDEDVLLLGDRELPIAEILAAPLRAIARAVTDTVGHLPPAVITCPAAWGTTRRNRLQEAAAKAGWPPVHLLAEPIAAARYFTETLGRPVPPGAVLAIFDFGGGTLDVALVRNDGATFTVIGSGGAEDLGGLDIDAAIVTHLGQILAVQHPQVWAQIDRPTDELSRRNRRAFWDDVRAAKEMLSRATSAPIPVPGVSASLHLTRDELEHLAAPLLRRATGQLTSAMRQAGLGPDRLSGIFLVGGASRIPLVSRLLHTETGIAPTVLEQPELPVAEGAVAGSAALAGSGSGRQPTSAPVSATPSSGLPVSGAPVSGLPVSGSPIGSVSGAPASRMGGGQANPAAGRGPVSGGPVSPPVSLHATPMGAFTNTAMPPMVPGQRPMPMPVWAPMPMPVPPRPPKRYRAWPWLLSVLLVIGGVCGAGYWFVLKPDEPFAVAHTATIGDLAPAALRLALLTDDWAFTLGQRTDGTIEVVTIDLDDDTQVRQQSTAKGPWASARAIGDWVAVFSQPAPTGLRTVELFNGGDNLHYGLELGKGDDITFLPSAGELEYLVFSPAAGVVRPGRVGPPGTPQPAPVPFPAGATMVSDLSLDRGEVVMITGNSGQFHVYQNGAFHGSTGLAPRGHPPALSHYDARSNAVWHAENKVGYHIFREGVPATYGPTDRQPVWLGACQTEICVLDQLPNDPASRELTSYGASGGETRRGPVPHAVPGRLTGTASSVYDVLIVPTLQGETVGAVTVDENGRTNTFAGTLLPLGGPDAVLIPARPAGGPADWAATPQAVDIAGVNLTNGTQKVVGTVTVRPGTCTAASGRLACAGADTFTVWEVNP